MLRCHLILFVMNILLCFFTTSWAAILNDPSEDFFKGKTKIDHPMGLRDPFKRPVQKEEKKVVLKEGLMQNGVFTNLPTIEGVPLKAIKIVGVLIGPERRAMAKMEKGEIVILKEGMKLGEENAEIKAILPGGIVLVEKIINVYGHEEYLETIIPISEDVKEK